MHIELTERGDPVRLAELRARNDAFRTSLAGGVVIVSSGIVALGREAQRIIIAAVRAFDDFDPDDVWDGHDIGDVEVTLPDQTKVLVFFRIVTGSSCDSAERLALFLFLASEW